MMGDVKTTGRVVGLFLLGCVLFGYPVLTVFNVQVLLLGIPLLYLYVFVVWLGFIVLIFGLAHLHLTPHDSASAKGVETFDSTA